MGNNRVKFTLSRDGFDYFISLIHLMKEDFLWRFVTFNDAPSDWLDRSELRGILNLLDSIAINSEFFKDTECVDIDDDESCVHLSFTPTEAKFLIERFIYFLGSSYEFYIPDVRKFHFDKFMELNDDFRNGNLVVDKPLSCKAAYEMYEWAMCGAVYLVKNKDGSCYFVDHGFTELVKSDERWMDIKWGAFGPCFVRSKINYDIVSWEDERPLDIWKYLRNKGWVLNKEFLA